jgi:protoheme IX farnesyltransferase
VVARKIVFYSYLMVGASLLLVPVGDAGLVYLVAAAALGGWFLREAHRLSARARAGADPKPMRLFHMSISYLTLLFAAVAVGQFLPIG